ncbi:flippase [Alloalcanivorax mobilis]|uniref:flippase n=1 Tax=Alloalcanivorax mobilis TaxID=2019569 RepID=UPI000B5B0D85|nr:flippase [Alloalcanivorax mobilis]ASK33667.1 flippase [Alcanivorax sp. N3-2A]
MPKLKFWLNKLLAQFPKTGLASMALMVGSTLLTALVAVFLARLLGPAGYGVYAFAFSLITVLAIPSQLGLPQLVVRETARAQVNGDWGLMRGLWRWSSLSVWLFSFAVAGAAWAVMVSFDWGFSVAQKETFLWGLVLIPVIALGNIRGAALRGLHRVIKGQLPEFILRPGLFLLLIFAVLYLLPLKLGPASAMALHGLAAFVAFLVGAWILYRERPAPLAARPAPRYQHRAWALSALPLAAIGALTLINSNTDILMLGFMRSEHEVGIYKVVVTGANLIIFGLQAINMVVAPQFSRLFTQKRMDDLQKIVTSSSRAILIIALPTVIVVVLFGRQILGVVFGEEYKAGYLPLVILGLGQLFNAFFGSVSMLLNMTNNERQTIKGVAVAALTNVVLNALLIPVYGIIGAAIATSISVVLWNLVLWYFVRKSIGIESTVIGRRKGGGS